VEGERITLLGEDPAGWSIPAVSEGQGREELLVTGDDGRGDWRQLLRFEEESGGRVRFARRRYAGGM